MRFEEVKIAGSLIQLPIAEKWDDIITLIRSDYCRYTNNVKKSILGLYLYSLRNHSFSYSFWWRFASFKNNNALTRIIFKLILKRKSEKFGMYIMGGVKAGYGLYLGHGTGIVINETAIIGNNVNISQFVSIGSNEGIAAKIGDNVYIGPMCCIVEDVQIGNNVTIGAGAVVTKSVQEGVTIAGVPAKVISNKRPGRFINNRYMCEF